MLIDTLEYFRRKKWLLKGENNFNFYTYFDLQIG